MRTFFLLLIIILTPTIVALSQGCVAIRSVGGTSPDLLFDNMRGDKKIIVNITNRYFEASKSYKGKEIFSDTLVRNRLYTFNISLLKIYENGWSIGLSIPVSANSRK